MARHPREAGRVRDFGASLNPSVQSAPLIFVPIDVGTDMEIVVIIGIGIAVGLVLLCTCVFVMKRKRAGRG